MDDPGIERPYGQSAPLKIERRDGIDQRDAGARESEQSGGQKELRLDDDVPPRPCLREGVFQRRVGHVLAVKRDERDAVEQFRRKARMHGGRMIRRQHAHASKIERIDGIGGVLRRHLRKAQMAQEQWALLKKQIDMTESQLSALATLYNIAPRGVQLSSISHEHGDGLLLEGCAETISGALVMLEGLRANNIFSEVNLKRIRRNFSSNKDFIHFDITCKVR